MRTHRDLDRETTTTLEEDRMTTERWRVMRGVVAASVSGALVVLVSLSAAQAADEKGAAVPEPAMKEAKEIFASRCTTCHGADGKGDGPAAAALNPKPRDFTDAAWQKTLSDEAIDKIIIGGGAAVGKSPMMPPNPDLANKPDVVKGLRVLVRGLAGSEPAKK
jgi:mono/diheme cytochrome c family protein